MNGCEHCVNAEIVNWEWDEKNKKSIPYYWCEKHHNSCDIILACDDLDTGDERIYADSDRLPPCRYRADIPDFYRK